MNLLLTGATGMLGSALLSSGRHRAHRVRAAARRVPLDQPIEGVEWRSVDLRTGGGLDSALDGVDVVLHAASAPRGESERTEVAGTQRLLDSASRAGVKHLVYVSIVGVDRIPLEYYRHKLAAETRVADGRVRWSIVRGTQFHELIDVWCRSLARSPVPLGMRGWQVQPIAAADFAGALWDTVEGPPQRRAPDVAGPEVLTWPEVLAAWRGATGRRPFAIGLPIPGALSRALRAGAACAPDHAVGRLTWKDWLARKYGPGA